MSRFERGVFASALAARLAFLAFFLAKDLESVYQRDLYFTLAQSWLGWLPPAGFDATHPPFYTAFIAFVLWLFRGSSALPLRLIQAVLSAASCVLAGRLGARLHSERAGKIAAVWTACDPGLIFFAPHLQTETLFIFMELVFFLRLYRCLEPEVSPRGAFSLGLLGGLSSLCRSVFAAFPAVLLPAAAFRLGRGVWLWGLLFSVGWLAPIAAWTARNWARYHEIIPISAQMGWTLYEGFTLDREEIRRRPYEMGEEAARLGLKGPVESARYFKAKTLGLIRENPRAAARIVLGKAALYWRPWPYDPHSPAQRAVLSVYFTALFLLAAWGAWLARGKLRLWLPVYGYFAYSTAMHSVFFTSLRYRMPLEPLLCILGAIGLERALRRADAH